jgi:hypothetical protein
MNNSQRIILTRLVVGYMLIFLVLRLVENSTPSGLMSPPLFIVQMDISYWLYRLIHIGDFIIYNHAGAIGFDFLLFASGCLCFMFPLQIRWVILFSILVFIYILTLNGFGMHHAHAMTGMMIVLLPFWVIDNDKFYLLWQGIRYYTCFLYGMAFIWKTLIKDSFFNWQQGIGSFKLNLVTYLYHNPHGLIAAFFRWCIREEWFLNAGNLLLMLIEASMLIGFFTKKWDRLLFWFPVFIHLTTYFFSDVLFFELLVLDFSFLSIKQLNGLGRFFQNRTKKRLELDTPNIGT